MMVLQLTHAPMRVNTPFTGNVIIAKVVNREYFDVWSDDSHVISGQYPWKYKAGLACQTQSLNIEKVQSIVVLCFLS